MHTTKHLPKIIYDIKYHINNIRTELSVHAFLYISLQSCCFLQLISYRTCMFVLRFALFIIMHVGLFLSPIYNACSYVFRSTAPIVIYKWLFWDPPDRYHTGSFVLISTSFCIIQAALFWYPPDIFFIQATLFCDLTVFFCFYHTDNSVLFYWYQTGRFLLRSIWILSGMHFSSKSRPIYLIGRIVLRSTPLIHI